MGRHRGPVRAAWLASGAPGQRPKLRRMQELPEAAFATADEAAHIFELGDRSLLVLSHAWRSPFEPDPDGATFACFVAFLRREAVEAAAERPDEAHELLLFVVRCAPSFCATVASASRLTRQTFRSHDRRTL